MLRCAEQEGRHHGHAPTSHTRQIIRKLAEGNKFLAGGMTVEEVCRKFQISESTWHRWLNQYGGMKADDAKRLKQLEGENSERKRLLAEAELDKAMLKRLASRNF
jgi:putative transposase